MKFFPIKYKLITILSSIVFLSLGGFFYLATFMFEKEKISSVYQRLLEDTARVEERLNTLKSNYHKTFNLMKYARDKSDFERILKNDPLIRHVSFRSQGLSLGRGHRIKFRGSYLNLKNKLLYSKIHSKNLRDDYSINLRHFMKDNSLIDAKGKRFFINEVNHIYPQKSVKAEVIRAFHEEVYKKGISSGIREIDTSKGRLIVSFTKVTDNAYFVSTILANEALASIQALKKKFLFYFGVILSVAVIISTIFTSSITSPLQELKDIMTRFGEGERMLRARINSTDEVGLIANVFNDMAQKTSNLIDEVKSYTIQLEGIVKKRTASLSKATRLQKAMMNAVDQGFFMVNKNLKLMDVYSKAATEHFQDNLKGKDIIDVLGFKGKEANTVIQVYNNLFKELMPFKDLVPLAPKMIKNKDGRDLALSYEPIRAKNESVLGFVVVSTDKTDELRLERQAEIEKKKGKMILKIVNGKLQFIKLLQSAGEFIDAFPAKIAELEGDALYNECFRVIHTLKGGFSTFFMHDVTELLHEYESRIKDMEPGDDVVDVVKEVFSKLEDLLDEFMIEYSSLVGEESWRNVSVKVAYDVRDIQDFVSNANNLDNVIDIKKLIDQRISRVPAKTFLNTLKDEAIDHCRRQGKRINGLEVIGEDVKVYPDFFGTFVSMSIHLLRNSIDHGLEMPHQRKEAGKHEVGKIEMIIREDSENLYVFFKDDGKGINTDVIKTKAIEKGMIVEGMSEKEIQMLIFDAGFSTASQVTDTSGRGVGMDAVKDFVESHGGTIDLNSTLGQGTEFIMKFPLSGIIDKAA